MSVPDPAPARPYCRLGPVLRSRYSPESRSSARKVLSSRRGGKGAVGVSQHNINMSVSMARKLAPRPPGCSRWHAQRDVRAAAAPRKVAGVADETALSACPIHHLAYTTPYRHSTSLTVLPVPRSHPRPRQLHAGVVRRKIHELRFQEVTIHGQQGGISV